MPSEQPFKDVFGVIGRLHEIATKIKNAEIHEALADLKMTLAHAKTELADRQDEIGSCAPSSLKQLPRPISGRRWSGGTACTISANQWASARMDPIALDVWMRGISSYSCRPCHRASDPSVATNVQTARPFSRRCRG